MHVTPIRRLFALLVLVSAAAHADGPLLWQNNSQTYLYGDNFAVKPPLQQTLTFEHASGWSVGDLFVFVDVTHFNGRSDPFAGRDAYYGELSPRLSLGKLSGRSIAFGPVTDLLVAATYEFGEGDVETWLLGPGVDLALRGFDYFKLNLYRRFPRHGRDGETVQLTTVWSMTFPTGGSDIVFDGFIDWNLDSDGRYHRNLHFNPQIKYDLGKRMGWGGKRLYVGLEYTWWSNKYGIRDSAAFDTDESTASLLLKAHF